MGSIFSGFGWKAKTTFLCEKTFLNTYSISPAVYRFLFFLLGLVYVSGLFVPLMDNDSAHHANIALHMYLTGDYVRLIDYGVDYLDKPHLHFWLTAVSYKIFGVNTFAYKFPSLLFTILGTYSTYRLGKTLYNKEAGRLAALIIASAFAYILANNDVRMDAILTAAIAFATWQLVEFADHKKILNVLGAGLGLAIGFCTKGHIAVFTPGIAILFYILYKRDWKLLINWKWLLLAVCFAIFIAPVVYCYYLQYNLHPEVTVRGKNKIDGVRFILWGQSIERFSGEMGSDAKNDRLFFLHSFLWAFAPWSIVAFIAIVNRLKTFLTRKHEWLTVGVFIVMLITISLSGFKLPHYLNIVFPATAILTASFLQEKQPLPSWTRIFFIVQLVVCSLILLLSLLIHAWAFPVKSPWTIIAVVFLLALVFYFIRSQRYDKWKKSILLSVSTMILAFFLLNVNFYPQLLTYQGGNQIARGMKDRVDPQQVYLWKNYYSSSFNFYTATIRKEFSDSVFQEGRRIWILADARNLEEIRKQGYLLGKSISARDYEITKIDLRFVDPRQREAQLNQMVLVEVLAKLY